MPAEVRVRTRVTPTAGKRSLRRWQVGLLPAGDGDGCQTVSVIFVNENENENDERRENNEFVNEN